MTDANFDETSLLIPRRRGLSNAADERAIFHQKVSVWLILFSAGFERLAFYALAGNLVLFLTSHNTQWSITHSVLVCFIFLGTSYSSALFFAWLSDNKLGRAKTIFIGFLLYIIGYSFMTLFSTEENYYNVHDKFCRLENRSNSTRWRYLYEENCLPQILSTLILTGIGAGAVQANMAVFGAEQVREQKTSQQYFDRYYAVVNTGGLLAFAFIAYVQQNISYFFGYIIPAGLLVVALILFLCGYKFYIHLQPDVSIVSNFIPVVINAFQTRRKYRQDARVSDTTGESSNPPRFYNRTNGQSASFLDYAKMSNDGKFLDRTVEDIKSLRPIIVVFLFLIPYWLIYMQIQTTFLIQGVHMKIPNFNLTGEELHYMPVVWLAFGDQLIIILTIFFLNTFIYKRLERGGRSFSIRSRIVFGMILATLAMCMAGAVEIFRQETCDSQGKHIRQNISGTIYIAANMSIFYQFPQYVAIGLSEVFASVASLEFAYLAAPSSAQSLIMSLRFCSAGLSSFFGAIYVGILLTIEGQLPFVEHRCEGTHHPQFFYIYFFVLAGLQSIFILLFLLCDRKFELLKISKRRLNTRLFVGPDSRETTG